MPDDTGEDAIWVFMRDEMVDGMVVDEMRMRW